MVDAASRTSPRLSLCNIDNGDVLEAQFNPNELQIALGVNYNRLQVTGLPHQPLQYVGTNNQTIRFQLYFRVDSPEDLEKRRTAERFIQSLAYPRQTSLSISQGGPPKTLVVWPNFLSFQAVLISAGWRVTRFNSFGDPVVMTTDLVFEELRELRLTQETVLDSGWERPVVFPEDRET
jgi:hypothetical protein